VPAEEANPVKLTSYGKGLVVVLVLTVIGTILLTPLGFETRPVARIHSLGGLVLGLVFVALALNVLSLLILSRRPEWAARLAVLGPFLFAPALAADQSGNFSALAPPFRITVVEYALSVIEVVAGILAYAVHRESSYREAPP
jgi:amino acid transporter